jgi:hypothetical protein
MASGAESPTNSLSIIHCVIEFAMFRYRHLVFAIRYEWRSDSDFILDDFCGTSSHEMAWLGE